jgi:4-diphosphocytidyl-2-C-methyl-D-erythritol kinase
VLAPGKVNLYLLIRGKRADGYHEIDTLMAKINIYDELFIRQSEKPGIEVLSSGPYWAPDGRDNLVYTACEKLLSHSRVKAGLKIHLTKNMPAGSGLGSGSSDASAAMIGVKKLLDLDIDQEEMMEISADFGSDAAFFLGGPMAVCTGKGEKIQKIQKKFNFTGMLVLPNINCSTAKVYANYTHDQAIYELYHKKIRKLVETSRFDLIISLQANMLIDSCLELYPDLARMKKEVETLVDSPVCLSGSGSTLFCLFEENDIDKAHDYKIKVEDNLNCRTVLISNNRW